MRINGDSVQETNKTLGNSSRDDLSVLSLKVRAIVFGILTSLLAVVPLVVMELTSMYIPMTSFIVVAFMLSLVSITILFLGLSIFRGWLAQACTRERMESEKVLQSSRENFLDKEKLKLLSQREVSEGVMREGFIEEERFLSEGTRKFLSEMLFVGDEIGDQTLLVSMFSSIIQQAGFVKRWVRSKVADLSNQMKVYLSFPHTASLKLNNVTSAFQNNFLEIPLAEEFKEVTQEIVEYKPSKSITSFFKKSPRIEIDEIPTTTFKKVELRASELLVESLTIGFSVLSSQSGKSTKTKARVASKRAESGDKPVQEPSEGVIALGGASIEKTSFSEVFQARFCRELFFIMLGYFSLEEIKNIGRLLSKKITPNTKEAAYRHIYHKLILKYPKIVAAESTFLNWLRKVYPYTLLCQDFQKYQVLFLQSLLANKDLEAEEGVVFLENFSGVVPASVASFLKEGKFDFNLNKVCSWKTFCQKVMSFSRKAYLYDDMAASIEKFEEYLEYGEDLFKKKKRMVLTYPDIEKSFGEKAHALWDMSELVNSSSSLLEKIEEGLASLRDVECLGGEVSALVQLERVVLGLEK
ncbi:hypothetical protein [Chlamydiifrater phoenicopteri]|uniref:hypothetical protein n=1 Tax=Chlamydiifrater phoenicopteri TaxID=2681469 RepID=UPI001BCB8BAA|nr:hypothetical protein [Chlamydiifrater phoenicopteri]